MDIRIGILNSPRELSLETASSADDIEQAVRTALTDGGVLSLTDIKGKIFLVPTAGLAYVEIGAEEQRRVGFIG